MREINFVRKSLRPSSQYKSCLQFHKKNKSEKIKTANGQNIMQKPKNTYQGKMYDVFYMIKKCIVVYK